MKSVIRLGNYEVLKTLTKILTFKFLVCDRNLKVMVMSADVADKNFWPESIIIPNRNKIHHLV